MSTGNFAWLPSRAIVQVSGNDARSFLQGLISNDMEKVSVENAVHAGLLSPQGKILFDFFVIEQPEGGFLLDTPRTVADDLIKKLTFYKLRADVDIGPDKASRSLAACWHADEPKPTAANTIIFKDPRDKKIGYRIIAPQNPATTFDLDEASENDYHAHRIECAVPEGGLDFAYGDTFPHEANFDQLAGVDFKKGCFVGQEVVSRVEHRGTARKRIIRISADADLPDTGAEILAADGPIGTLGSTSHNLGLALIRIDRATEALRNGNPILAGDIPVTLSIPQWAEAPNASPETN